jgi:hypothetical protein
MQHAEHRKKVATLIGLLTIGMLLPFVNKALHIDDPIYVSVAAQILTNPFDFFGFNVNWLDTPTPAYVANQNPPLTSYFMALIWRLFGASEVIFHTAFLLAAILVTTGTYRLAQAFNLNGLPSAMITLSSPVFLVSATTLMADTLLLAMYVWAVVFWLERSDKNNWKYAAISMIAIITAILTKYVAVTLLPLLITYTAIREKRIGLWFAWFTLPVAALIGYEFYTASMYGQGHFLGATNYSVDWRNSDSRDVVQSAISTLSFFGGTGLAVFFLMNTRRGATLPIVLTSTTIASLFLLFSGPLNDQISSSTPLQSSTLYISQLAIFCTAGICILWLALSELLRTNNHVTWFIFLLIFGIFLFSAVFNWTTSARSVLPALPAIAILLERQIKREPHISMLRVTLSIVVVGTLGFSAALADMRLANAQREASILLYKKFESNNEKTWFIGHWGFQYYMEQLGAVPIDFHAIPKNPGHILVIPRNNTYGDPSQFFEALEIGRIQIPVNPVLSTMHPDVGAGFYSSNWGFLPFAFGAVPPEDYLVLKQ